MDQPARFLLIGYCSHCNKELTAVMTVPNNEFASRDENIICVSNDINIHRSFSGIPHYIHRECYQLITVIHTYPIINGCLEIDLDKNDHFPEWARQIEVSPFLYNPHDNVHNSSNRLPLKKGDNYFRFGKSLDEFLAFLAFLYINRRISPPEISILRLLILTVTIVLVVLLLILAGRPDLVGEIIRFLLKYP